MAVNGDAASYEYNLSFELLRSEVSIVNLLGPGLLARLTPMPRDQVYVVPYP